MTIKSDPPKVTVINSGTSVFFKLLLSVIADIMKPTSPAYIGIYLLPDSIGVSDLIINFFALK